MGELIQVRVTARIHDQDKAVKRWSTLVKLAFGHDMDQGFDGSDLLTKLVEALYDKDRLGQLSKEGQILSTDIQTAHTHLKKLHSLLAERNPQEADKVSYKLEDLLDIMQEAIK